MSMGVRSATPLSVITNSSKGRVTNSESEDTRTSMFAKSCRLIRAWAMRAYTRVRLTVTHWRIWGGGGGGGGGGREPADNTP